jgi:exopolyphosphatase / guanosine-5'-triphosphate,3'-diphosphate pyrophosphatase
MKIPGSDSMIAAVDLGANAVRLEMGRALPDGSIEITHQERDPIRPGRGVFMQGAIPAPVVARLVATLRRYGSLCRRHHARVRVVATSALREARNRDEIVRRVKREAKLDVEIISGKEEARLICLGVLHGRRPTARSLCIDIGGGSTEVAVAQGERATHLWSLALGTVRLTELFKLGPSPSRKQVQLMREYAREAAAESLPRVLPGAPKMALGSSGSIRTLVDFAASEGTSHATAKQLGRAVDKLAAMSPVARRQRFDSGRADILLAGAVILEALARRISLQGVTAVDRGLRDGVLVDLLNRSKPSTRDQSLADEALALGRRFHFDEEHARQVATLALALFDQIPQIHRLQAAVRPYLEAAAWLHDIGNAVNYQKHHRHTEYLVRNADISGLTDRERDLVARIARYHRRSHPDLHHSGMLGLTRTEAMIVRKLATLLRVADALDRSHTRPVRRLSARVSPDGIQLRLFARGSVDLELWDVAREASLFRQVFRRRLQVEVAGTDGKRRRI